MTIEQLIERMSIRALENALGHASGGEKVTDLIVAELKKRKVWPVSN